nr:MAG TPA: hypothetical protein [Caudoviricetes sp.]DAZ58497.1 MAG TPA: hypothetical protein [Caudoviricetes sp.]
MGACAPALPFSFHPLFLLHVEWVASVYLPPPPLCAICRRLKTTR